MAELETTDDNASGRAGNEQNDCLDNREDVESLGCFGKLPRELRWMILAYLERSTAEMRLVNRSWYWLVEQWVSAGNAMLQRVEIIENSDRTIGIMIMFEKKKSSCFPELRNFFQNSVNITTEIKFIDIRSIKMTFTLPFGSNDLDNHYPLLRMRARIIIINGEKGDQDETHFCTCAINVLRNLKKVDWLVYSRSHMNDESANFFVELRSAVPIRYLDCDFTHSNLSNPQNFMIRVAGIFKSIRIRQPLMLTNSNVNPFRVNPERKAPFFSQGVNWAEVFLAMFDAGLCKLNVENWLGDHVTATDTLHIIQTLNSRGKEKMFRTSMNEAPTQLKGKPCKISSQLFGGWVVMSEHWKYEFNFSSD